MFPLSPSLSLSATINSIIITFIAITMLPTLGGLSDRSENLKVVRFKRPSLSCHFFKNSERLSCSCFHGASSAITGLRLYIVDDSSMERTRKLRGRRQSSFCGITKRRLDRRDPRNISPNFLSPTSSVSG